MHTTLTEREAVTRYLSETISILSHMFQGKHCRIYLFGSRAIGDDTETSDFDIAVLASESVSRELSIAREMIEASNIPFAVDLVDLSGASETLVRRVQEKGILLWSN